MACNCTLPSDDLIGPPHSKLFKGKNLVHYIDGNKAFFYMYNRVCYSVQNTPWQRRQIFIVLQQPLHSFETFIYFQHDCVKNIYKLSRVLYFPINSYIFQSNSIIQLFHNLTIFNIGPFTIGINHLYFLPPLLSYQLV